ncbi:MAG TPA: CcoQ/FixQ family Cbb3-type cytochrome c oxidase assembly chaperone [Bacteroidia bacterium]|nr:CcoQ/FixQ family Cbb3-type cytochrome c oxidase assembly chaperone [Bacteroidia bacterium]
MKFITYLETISGIGIYPLVSLLIFFLFFVILFVRVIFMDKTFINEMGQLPLEDNKDGNETMLGI